MTSQNWYKSGTKLKSLFSIILVASSSWTVVRAASTPIQGYCINPNFGHVTVPPSSLQRVAQRHPVGGIVQLGAGPSESNWYRRPSFSERRKKRDTTVTLEDVLRLQNITQDFLEQLEVPVSRNIISGEPMVQRTWPFLVALLTVGDTIPIEGEETDFDWRFSQASDFRIRIGDYNIMQPNDVPTAIDARILRYTAHPRYDHSAVELGYDIALVQLDRSVLLNDWVQPCCLPVQDVGRNAVPSPGSPCEVAGWGATNNLGRISPIPRYTVIPASTTSRCYSTLGIPLAARDGRLFCAGDASGRRDSCSGDSGGPIFCLASDNTWHFSGIVSFGGERCAQRNVPGAYTALPYFVDWVQQTMQRMMAASNINSPPPQQFYAQPVQQPRTPPGANLQQGSSRSPDQLLQLLQQLLDTVGTNADATSSPPKRTNQNRIVQQQPSPDYLP